MSPPEDCYYNDMYWEDMPEVAKKAATTLGYTNETWDNDETIPYDTKSFAECTIAEKQAAMFLNLNPIGKKLNLWWEDVDETTKNHAINIGWTPEKWDEDYEIEHLEVEQMYWADLDTKQKEAASYFGYTKATWDETWDPTDFNMSSSSSSSSGGHNKKPHTTNHTSSKPTQATTNSNDDDNNGDDDKKKPIKMFVPPPKGKVFGKKPDDDKDEKKEDEHHKLGHKLVQPFKKLFNKDDK